MAAVVPGDARLNFIQTMANAYDRMCRVDECRGAEKTTFEWIRATFFAPQSSPSTLDKEVMARVSSLSEKALKKGKEMEHQKRRLVGSQTDSGVSYLHQRLFRSHVRRARDDLSITLPAEASRVAQTPSWVQENEVMRLRSVYPRLYGLSRDLHYQKRAGQLADVFFGPGTAGQTSPIDMLAMVIGANSEERETLFRFFTLLPPSSALFLKKLFIHVWENSTREEKRQICRSADKWKAELDKRPFSRDNRSLLERGADRIVGAACSFAKDVFVEDDPWGIVELPEDLLDSDPKDWNLLQFNHVISEMLVSEAALSKLLLLVISVGVTLLASAVAFAAVQKLAGYLLVPHIPMILGHCPVQAIEAGKAIGRFVDLLSGVSLKKAVLAGVVALGVSGLHEKLEKLIGIVVGLVAAVFALWKEPVPFAFLVVFRSFSWDFKTVLFRRFTKKIDETAPDLVASQMLRHWLEAFNTKEPGNRQRPPS